MASKELNGSAEPVQDRLFDAPKDNGAVHIPIEEREFIPPDPNRSEADREAQAERFHDFAVESASGVALFANMPSFSRSQTNHRSVDHSVLSVSNKRRKDDERGRKPFPSGTAERVIFNGLEQNYRRPGPYSEATEAVINEHLAGGQAERAKPETTARQMEEFDQALKDF